MPHELCLLYQRLRKGYLRPSLQGIACHFKLFEQMLNAQVLILHVPYGNVFALSSQTFARSTMKHTHTAFCCGDAILHFQVVLVQ